MLLRALWTCCNRSRKQHGAALTSGLDMTSLNPHTDHSGLILQYFRLLWSITHNCFPFSHRWFCEWFPGLHVLIQNIYTWLDIVLPFHPGTEHVQPIEPRCADQNRSSRAIAVILDIVILLLCTAPQQSNQCLSFIISPILLPPVHAGISSSSPIIGKRTTVEQGTDVEHILT